ncbi:MAG: TonB-dependent receptor [Bacteroidetes bacterium]|nr:TonB-dependent receptor [Bacteroidota bacterium]
MRMLHFPGTGLHIPILRILMAVLFAGKLAASAPGEISGQVLNEQGDGIHGVHIYIEDTRWGTVTNAEGFFLLGKIPAGEYKLVAKSVGFEPFSLLIELNESKVEITIHLKEGFQVLKGLTIESISITGGEDRLNDIPGSAQFISPKELARFNSNDIMQILRNIPGVNLQEEDGFGLRPNIGLRGTGVERSSKITVMEDGILIAPAPYVAPSAYYFPSAGRMQGIEVRKGSSQIKYGPYTTGGAINLISTSIPDDFMGRVHLYGGSFGKRTLHAFAGDASEHVGFIAETYQSAADGFKELDNNGDTGFKTEDYLLKFRINTSEEANVFQALSFSAGKYKERSFETYLGLTDADFDENPLRRYAGSQKDVMNARHGQLSLSYVMKPSDQLSITATAYKTDFFRNWYKLDKVKSSDSSGYAGISNILADPENYMSELKILKGADSPEDALAVKANNRNYYAKGIQFQASWQLPDGMHDFDFGLRIHQDQIDRFQWRDWYKMQNGAMMMTRTGIHGTESNRVETADAIASYIQYRFQVANWKLSPGIRYEKIDMNRMDYGIDDPERTGKDLKVRENNVDVWIPGIGIEYEISPAWKVFTGIHKGFSPPGTKEGTNPEISVNYETGVRHNTTNFEFSAILFYTHYQNLLGTDLAASGGTGTGDLFNGGEANSSGIEFGMQYRYLPYPNSIISFPFSMSYTYTQAVFLNDFESENDAWGNVKAGDNLPYISPNQLVINAGMEHPKYNINLSSRYASPMRTVAGQGKMERFESTDTSFILDLSVQYNLSWRIGFFGSVHNLTNHTFIVARRPAGVRPAMPRNFTVGIKANF